MAHGELIKGKLVDHKSKFEGLQWKMWCLWCLDRGCAATTLQASLVKEVPLPTITLGGWQFLNSSLGDSRIRNPQDWDHPALH